MAKHRTTQITPYDTPCTLIGFLTQNVVMKFEWGHPHQGRQNRWDRLKLATFDQCLAISQKRYKTETYM